LVKKRGPTDKITGLKTLTSKQFFGKITAYTPNFTDCPKAQVLEKLKQSIN